MFEVAKEFPCYLCTGSSVQYKFSRFEEPGSLISLEKSQRLLSAVHTVAEPLLESHFQWQQGPFRMQSERRFPSSWGVRKHCVPQTAPDSWEAVKLNLRLARLLQRAPLELLA